MTFSPLNFTRRVWQEFLTVKGHDYTCLRNLDITEANLGHVSAILRIEKSHLNRVGSLHGGLIATLIDVGGSLALASKGLFSTGVTTDLNVTCIRNAGTENDVVEIQAFVIAMGRTLGFTQVKIVHPETKKVFAQGRHTKYIAEALKHELNQISSEYK